MYTNGLKDRYGSPLISLNDGDERYVVRGEIEYSNKRIEQKINAQDKFIEHHEDKIIDLFDKSHQIKVELECHKKDTDVHFEEGEKVEWDEVNKIVLGVYPTFDFSTNKTNYTGETEGYSIQLDKADFIPGGSIIQQVRLPYKRALNNSEKYCHIIVFDSNSTQIGKTIVSYDTHARTTGSDAILISTWNFENKVLPEDYAFVRIALSPNATLTNLNGDANFRINVSRNTNNQNINPSNLSKLVNGNGSTQPYLGWVEVTTVSTERQNIKEEFTSIIDNISTEIRTQFGERLDETNETIDTYNESFDGKIENLKGILGYSYGTIENATALHDANGINVVSSKLPHNIVFDEIRIPAENTSTNSYYLAIWSVLNGTKTHLGHSDTAIQWSAGEDAVWTFKNAPFSIPDNSNLEMFLAATLDDILQNTTNVTSEQIKCYYVSGNRNESGSIRNQNTWQFSKNTFVILRKAGHIGDDTHLTDTQKSAIQNVISGNYVTNEELGLLLEQSSQKQQYYDTWTNLNDGYFVDKADAYSFQLDKNDFVSGRIDRIEIPYVKGNNATGHLCVQFFDSSNNVIDTYYSINKQTQNITGEHARGICEYEFVTFETPENYSFVRFSMVANTSVVPTGNSGTAFRVMPIGYGTGNDRFLWNTNTNTKINNTGTRWTILLSVLTRKIGKDTGITIRQYDWTPDVFCPINVTLSTAGTAFVAPTNGWIISKSSQTTSGANSLTLNGIEIGASGSTAQADLQVLMRKGEFITATTAYNLVFFPCKSEQFDYRLENTHSKYDIWKGAIIYDENGESSVQDLYIPNASAWKNEVGHEVIGRISTIVDEKAYDSNGYVLFNIQSQYITNGNYMFIQSSITTFDADLGALTSGAQMFAGARLTSWNTNLPNLLSGETMFYACPNLSSFSADVHSMTTGWNMFMNCSNLTTVSFVGGLDALTNGTCMFKGCSLSYTSLNNILAALPARNGNVIEITVADNVKDNMLNDPQWEGVSIPAHNSGNYYGFTHNGWEVRLTSRTGFSLSSSSYDLSEVNGYIPDASQWNTNVYVANNLNIVSVVDGVAYDGLV